MESTLDVRLDTPVPPEIISLMQQCKEQIIDPATGQPDAEKIVRFVQRLNPELKKGIYERWFEAKRRRLEERSRYYSPLDAEKDGSPQLQFHQCDAKIILLSGGNQCLGAEQEIHDPVLGKKMPIGAIQGNFHVYAWTGNQAVVANASRPFTKGIDDIYRLKFSNGAQIICGQNHKILASCGVYIAVKYLLPGDEFIDAQGTVMTLKTKTAIRHDYIWDTTVEEWGNYIIDGVVNHNSGKTEAACQEANWCATGTHPYKRTWEPPCFIRINSVSWAHGHGLIIIPKLKEIIKREDLVGGTWESAFSTNPSNIDGGGVRLNFKNGSFIEFLTYDQEPSKHGGVQRHLIVCDEEPTFPIYRESLERLSRYNGRLIISMTPVNGITWTYEELYENESVKKFFLPKLANKHLPKSSHDFDRQRYADDPEEALIRLDGVPVDRGGLVIRSFREEHHVCDDFKIPINWPRAILIDPAPSKAHAAVWMTIDPRTFHNPSQQHKAYFYKELLGKEGCGIEEFCRLLVETNDGDYINYFRIDPHWDWENKATRTEGKTGFNIFREFKKAIPMLKPALANEESKNGGWIYYEAIKNRIIVDLMARDINSKVGVQWFQVGAQKTIRQIKKLAYVVPKNHISTDKPRVNKKDDDLVDCCGMGLVDPGINNLSTIGSQVSRLAEPNYRRCPVTGRILS